jgi:hypothetical protein
LKAFGWKKSSPFLKRDARNDDGNRKAFWWRKPAKPRETGDMLDYSQYISIETRDCCHPYMSVSRMSCLLVVVSVQTAKCRDEGGPAQAQGSAGANNSLLNISTLRPDRILSCTTQPARLSISANWSPWLHSLPYVGHRRALPRSNVAAMAREEVRSNSGIRRKTADNSKAFHPAAASLAAHNFSMPALSPTMTEGNIATWKIKEGTTDPLCYRASAP